MIEQRRSESVVLDRAIFLLVCKIIICSLLFAIVIVGCSSKDKPDKISAIKNRAVIPKLRATDITTVISDSGITRYRISTPRWDVYDKASQPYWEFPRGIHFERFDENLKVDANIHSKYAKYKQNEQVWELRGKVRLTNLQGELFETEQLFWDQRQERFYSDKLIKITRTSGITTGIGFESNQSMTKYQIKRPQGVFPVSEHATATPPSTPPSRMTKTPIPSSAPKK